LYSSEGHFSDAFADRATVEGSTVLKGGVTIGAGDSTPSQIYLDGADGLHKLRFEGDRTSFWYDQTRHLSWNESFGTLHGTWHSESPLTIDAESSPALYFSETSTGKQAQLQLSSSGETFPTFSIEVGGEALLSASGDGNPSWLYGSWNVDHIQVTTTVSTSDRRLKSDIRSLSEGVSTKGGDHSPEWVLRQLRPVSFKYRSVDDAPVRVEQKTGERVRYGFVADEVEQVLPETVHNLGEKGADPDLQGVTYQDFIALLVAAQQASEARMAEMEKRLSITEQLLEYMLKKSL